MRKIIVLLSAIALSGTIMAAQDFSSFAKHVKTNPEGKEMPYRLLSPAKMEKGVKYPLFVVLHGMGRRGTDNEQQLAIGAHVFVNEMNREKYPCFVLYPQTPETFVELVTRNGKNKGGFSMWSKNLDSPEMAETTTEISAYGKMVIGLIRELIHDKAIDPDRIYLAGSSMGAYSTYHLISEFPEMFAAAAPMGGGADIRLMKNWAGKVPVWIVHGLADTIVTPENDERIISELKKAGADFRYTLYEGVPHNCWDKAFKEPDFLEWFFKYRKNK